LVLLSRDTAESPCEYKKVAISNQREERQLTQTQDINLPGDHIDCTRALSLSLQIH
jgi:hypothetical protein